MKTFKMSMVLWLFISLMSCSDEEKLVTMTGNIDVLFNATTDGVIVYVFDLDNFAIQQRRVYPIYTLSVPNGSQSSVNVQVNAGNYLIMTNGEHEWQSFQVIPGKTTSIVYNSKNEGTVSRN